MINIENYGVVNIGDAEIWITETVVNTWIIMAILIAAAVAVRISMKKWSRVPKGSQNAAESVIEIFDNFATDSMGQKMGYTAGWFFAFFMLILSSALFSIFGMRAPTADWATTFGLALIVFVMMVVLGIRHRKGSYLRTFIEPNIIFFPLNLIGELAKPVSLSFRLFGNMLSGTIILTLYYALTPIFVQFGIPALLHGFFDIIFGALQTYIFVIISMMYVQGSTA